MSKVAESCGQDLQIVRSKLSSVVNHEQASVQISGQAYHVLSLGNFSPEGLKYLCEKMKTQEKRQLERLYLVHAALCTCSESLISPFDDDHSDYACGSDAMTSDEDKEETPDLRTMIQQYFSEESLDRAYFDNLDIPVWPKAETTTAKQKGRIRRDVQSLIHSEPDYKFTGKSVARVFHGIASPHFTHLWGWKNLRFWRKHLDISFDNLCSIANEELTELNAYNC